jgi:hypothetical protein
VAGALGVLDDHLRHVVERDVGLAVLVGQTVA